MAAAREQCSQVATDRDLFTTVMDGLADGLTLHDAEGRYQRVSRSFCALSGYAVDDLVGRSPYDVGLFHPEDVDRVVDVQAEALATGEPWRVLYRLRRNDGVFTWVESTGRVVAGPEGDCFIVSTRRADHLESLVQGVEAERRMKRGYEELVARQQRFLTTVSHRARTPLTSVVGIVELLRRLDGELTDAQRSRLLERLEVNAKQLQDLMEDVTHADRLSRSDVLLERRVVDLHRVVVQVVDELTDEAGRVTNAVPQGLRAVVDDARLRQMLRILLGNSFKHAGMGAAVTVRAAVRHGDGVEVVVEDDGPGVAPALREHVFQPFAQADEEAPDPGAGLGLYIVAELAALHGGRAWVDGGPAGGARFHVWLPRSRTGSPSRETQQGPRSRAELRDRAATPLP